MGEYGYRIKARRTHVLFGGCLVTEVVQPGRHHEAGSYFTCQEPHAKKFVQQWWWTRVMVDKQSYTVEGNMKHW